MFHRSNADGAEDTGLDASTAANHCCDSSAVKFSPAAVLRSSSSTFCGVSVGNHYRTCSSACLWRNAQIRFLEIRLNQPGAGRHHLGRVVLEPTRGLSTPRG